MIKQEIVFEGSADDPGSLMDVNQAFLKTINEHKGKDPNGWQMLFEEFKDCMGKENNAFKAWTLCQQRTAGLASKPKDAKP